MFATNTNGVLRPLSRAPTLAGGLAFGTLAPVGLLAFWLIANNQQRETAGRYADSETRAVAATMDSFDRTLAEMTHQVFAGFRRQFAPTRVLEDAARGTLSSAGQLLNGNMAAVDEFARDYAGGVATVFALSGDDLHRITTSLKKENGERAVGTRATAGRSGGRFCL